MSIRDMEKGRKTLRKYVHKLDITLKSFCDQTGISYHTMRNLYNNNACPQRLTAKRLVDASKGKFTLSDFGFDE